MKNEYLKTIKRNLVTYAGGEGSGTRWVLQVAILIEFSKKFAKKKKELILKCMK